MAGQPDEFFPRAAKTAFQTSLNKDLLRFRALRMEMASSTCCRRPFLRFPFVTVLRDLVFPPKRRPLITPIKLYYICTWLKIKDAAKQDIHLISRIIVIGSFIVLTNFKQWTLNMNSLKGPIFLAGLVLLLCSLCFVSGLLTYSFPGALLIKCPPAKESLTRNDIAETVGFK